MAVAGSVVVPGAEYIARAGTRDCAGTSAVIREWLRLGRSIEQTLALDVCVGAGGSRGVGLTLGLGVQLGLSLWLLL